MNKEFLDELRSIMFEAQTSLPRAEFEKRLSILATKAEAYNEHVGDVSIESLVKLCDSLRYELQYTPFRREKYGLIYGFLTNNPEGMADPTLRQSFAEFQKVVYDIQRAENDEINEMLTL